MKVKKDTCRMLLRREASFMLLFWCLSIGMKGYAGSVSLLDKMESQRFNFGLGFGIGFHTLGIDRSQNFLEKKDFLSITPSSTAGFFVHFITNYNLNKHFALRSNFPLFHYSNYYIRYIQNTPDQKEENFIFDHFKLSLPVELIFKSDIIGNFRFYTSLGFYTSYNFTTNSSVKNTHYLTINRLDKGFTIGLGFMFGGEFTITHLELKYQYGFGNIFTNENGVIYSDALDKLKTRNLVLVISFQ